MPMHVPPFIYALLACVVVVFIVRDLWLEYLPELQRTHHLPTALVKSETKLVGLTILAVLLFTLTFLSAHQPPIPA